MSFLIAGAVVGIGAGVAKAISGGKQKKAAKAAEAKAKAEMEKQKAKFSELDTSNPYANMENKMEDLTVNQGEADFMKEQQQASQANIMQQMKGAAGGSGIAALAQTMANQGSMDAQKSAVSIGKQEAGNQMAERQASSQIQNQERQGEVMSRDMERNKVSTLLGMSQSDVAAQGEKVAAADSKMWSGITGAAGAAAGGLGNMNAAGMFGATPLPTSPAPMKGSPLKQADQTLVQGAYAAAGGGRQKQDGMAQGMDDLMKITGKMGADMAKNRQEAGKKGDELAQGILDTGGALGTGWLDATRGEVEGMHGDYKTAAAFNRKGKKAKGMQDLNTLSAEIASLKDLNTQIAKWQGPPGEKSDWSESLNAEDQGVISSFMDPNSKKRIGMVDGVRVFEVETPQGWMTSKEIETLATDKKQDYTTMVDVRKQALDQVDKAKKDAFMNLQTGYTGGGYDITKATAKMDTTLKSANLVSMMHDDVLENGEPFITAVTKNPEITGMTYESLGLTSKDIVAKVDSNNDGIIQDNEKQTLLELGHKDMIVDALTNPKNELYNEETSRGLVANYFTSFISQNYEQEYGDMGGKYSSDAGEDTQLSDADYIKKYSVTENK